MALSPLSSPGTINVLEIQNRASQKLSNDTSESAIDSGAIVSERLDMARNGSVLYQVVTKILDVNDGSQSSGSTADESINNNIPEKHIYNRLLTTRLVGNKQFLDNLQGLGIKTIDVEVADINASQDEQIVQLEEYREEKRVKSVVDMLSTYREISENRD